MIITKEQLQKAIERRNRRVGKVNAATKKRIAVTYISIVLAAVFFGSYLFSKQLVFVFLMIIFLIFAAFIFIMNGKAINRLSINEHHRSSSSSITDLNNQLRAEFYSDDFMTKANYILSSEKDPYSRGYIRNLLTSGYFFRGEFDIAFRTNFRDEELFAKDKYYELQYLYNKMYYYLNVPSTTGGTEYGEEAYRQFNALLESGKTDKNNFEVLSAAVFCEINYALAHGDWQKALDHIDIFSILYSNVKQSSSLGLKIEYADFMINKAEALFHLGRVGEAKAIVSETAEYLRAFPYRYNKAQQLLQAILQN